ncbi:HalOD1 output domain-containing protein [Halobacterium zhouii]|uniref:HalOD1 output domain-containing protein n=1 Tax=Halobacterium zhouii TaxID=2902624 RepID=UPI001E64CB0F|nr:HalOD1 output domain-containing protein [Halobacterium zhouii]
MSETASDAVRTDYHGTRPSEAVVLAVADARDTDPLDLEPLNNVIDPDALDRLFQSAGEESTVGELSFTMEGCEVVVHGDGDIVVTPPVTADEGGGPVAVRED